MRVDLGNTGMRWAAQGGGGQQAGELQGKGRALLAAQFRIPESPISLENFS
jgi:hypothetical protein